MMNKHERLLEAFKPFQEALEKNETDTIGRTISDSAILFTLSGSWASPKAVTLGDLRKLAEAINGLSHPQALAAGNRSGKTVATAKALTQEDTVEIPVQWLKDEIKECRENAEEAISKKCFFTAGQSHGRADTLEDILNGYLSEWPSGRDETGEYDKQKPMLIGGQGYHSMKILQKAIRGIYDDENPQGIAKAILSGNVKGITLGSHEDAKQKPMD